MPGKLSNNLQPNLKDKVNLGNIVLIKDSAAPLALAITISLPFPLP